MKKPLGMEGWPRDWEVSAAGKEGRTSYARVQSIPAGSGAATRLPPRTRAYVQRIQRGVNGGSHHWPFHAFTAPIACTTKAKTKAAAYVTKPTSTSIRTTETIR